MKASFRGNPPEIGAPEAVMSLPLSFAGFNPALDGRVLVVQQKTAGATLDALHILLNWGPSLR
jgi:hypothetical protein